MGERGWGVVEHKRNPSNCEVEVEEDQEFKANLSYREGLWSA